MSDPASRQAALIAAAALIGPAIPPAMVVNRPHEAVTALTRMADLLVPWLEAEARDGWESRRPYQRSRALCHRHHRLRYARDRVVVRCLPAAGRHPCSGPHAYRIRAESARDEIGRAH